MRQSAGESHRVHLRVGFELRLLGASMELVP